MVKENSSLTIHPMLLSETIHKKISLIEEVINFPTSLLSHKNYHWENLPLVPYSDLTGAVSSLVEKGKEDRHHHRILRPSGRSSSHGDGWPSRSPHLAEGLKYLGMEVSLLSDEYTLSALKAGLKILNLSEKEIPIDLFSTGAFRPGSHQSNDE